MTEPPDYPPHEHQFVVNFYEQGQLDRMFGPFATMEEAREWSRAFNKRYAPKDQFYRYLRSEIYPICAAHD
jgi:hypothetical protein